MKEQLWRSLEEPITQRGFRQDIIACKDCENKFHCYDDYFVNFYREIYLKKQKKIISSSGNIFHLYEDIDCGLLYGFFAFHLLRASLTSHDFYSEVNLGEKYTKILIGSLLKNDPTLASPIEIIVCTYNEKIRIQSAVNIFV